MPKSVGEVRSNVSRGTFGSIRSRVSPRSILGLWEIMGAQYAHPREDVHLN